MAQWIPKTAWRVSNLNKRYGPSYLTAGHIPLSTFDRAPSLYDAMTLQAKLSGAEGLVMIDVRDFAERHRHPIPGAVALHPHDLLSGAACPILPQQKEAAELFLVTSSGQRGLCSSTALQRWGYNNVVVVDYETLRAAGYIHNPAGCEKSKVELPKT
ncbi:hypothetical protein TRSC58_03519 [Trypanosoma rangeli SC58]|uniref:Rhodanese domain-containing protein n=1 Tax=Trypanosoma rangeli SC58 TaxID=429131 RepID=A0A061J037_TRYRA|nr:hypothetical protein TRSC58_03519 [Trypanosoma rangeli SC58]